MNEKSKGYGLPMLVGRDLRPLERSGMAYGWSVMDCTDRDHALSVMRQYPAARMPCWQLIERGEM